MFTVEEFCTILNSLRYFCEHNASCADEITLADKVMKMAELARLAESKRLIDTLQQKI